MLHADAIARLIEAGLSEKEAHVYVAMLACGPSVVQDIAARSDMPRASVYAALDALAARGLVTQYEEEKRTIYVAEAPKRLVELVEREAQTLHERREKLVFFVPELEALFQTQRHKPVVRFYEGEEGLRSFRDYLARQRTERAAAFVRLDADLLAMAATDQDRLRKMFDPQSEIRVLCVTDPDTGHAPFPAAMRSPLHEIRYTRSVPFTFSGEIGIQDHSAYLATITPRMTACVLESPALASLLRALFELAWNNAAEQA
jgi:HTH-type transcriptional regulator, sugar sensing transcriptional regulator